MFFRNKISSLGDEELLLLYRRDGKSEIVGELFSRYSHLVFGVCMKYLRNKEDARDATFSLFEKLIADLKTHEILKFPHWLSTVSRNHCLMILRSKNTSQAQLSQLVQSWKNESNSPDQDNEKYIEKESNLQELELALKSLNDVQQNCVRLFYLENKSYQQICELTGLAINEVKSHVQNGRRNLRIKLTGTA